MKNQVFDFFYVKIMIILKSFKRLMRDFFQFLI